MAAYPHRDVCLFAVPAVNAIPVPNAFVNVAPPPYEYTLPYGNAYEAGVGYLTQPMTTMPHEGSQWTGYPNTGYCLSPNAGFQNDENTNTGSSGSSGSSKASPPRTVPSDAGSFNDPLYHDPLTALYYLQMQSQQLSDHCCYIVYSLQSLTTKVMEYEAAQRRMMENTAKNYHESESAPTQ